jgi:hypothetical protein
MGSEAGVRMSPCEREDVGSEGHHVEDLKSSVKQHFSSHAGDDGAHGSSVPFHRRSICEGFRVDEPVSRIVLGTD